MFGQYSNSPRPHRPMFPCSDTPPDGGRAKHVFGSHDSGVEHIWAHPESHYQTHGRNPGGNFYFKTDADGTRVLYSYRDSYPIASLFTVRKGKRVRRVYLLRCGAPYSNTTAGHMSAARCAIPQTEIKFSVPDVTSYRYSGMPTREDHTANLADILARITEAIEKYKKAKSFHNIVNYRIAAVTLTREAKKYAKFFKLKLPKLPAIPKLDAKKLETIKLREAESAIRKEEKRKREREQYEAQRAQEVAEWESSGICNHTPKHSLFDRYTCQQERDREEWEQNKTELIASWKAGESVQLRFGYSDFALLRVRPGSPDNAASVETSQHVTVPISGHSGAARLLRFLQAIKQDGRTYQRNGHTEHIGNFAVDKFEFCSVITSEPQYVLFAGCHKILYSEIESVADAVFKAEADEATPRS